MPLQAIIRQAEPLCKECLCESLMTKVGGHFVPSCGTHCQSCPDACPLLQMRSAVRLRGCLQPGDKVMLALASGVGTDSRSMSICSLLLLL